MSSSSSGTIPPTPAETALAQIGANRFQDYVERWEPLQMHLASQVESMGGADSWQRQEAEGKAKAEVGQQFSTAENQTASKQLSAGVNAGSEKFGLAQAEMTSDQARSGGERTNEANEAVTSQYLSGLTALTAIGRGQSSTASQGMGIATDIGTRTAISDAAASSAARSGNEQMLGYGIGMAGAAASSYFAAPQTGINATAQYGLSNPTNPVYGQGDAGYGPGGYAPGMGPSPADYSNMVANFSSVPMGPPNAGSGLSYR
jgi:hypothetical protein